MAAILRSASCAWCLFLCQVAWLCCGTSAVGEGKPLMTFPIEVDGTIQNFFMKSGDSVGDAVDAFCGVHRCIPEAIVQLQAVAEREVSDMRKNYFLNPVLDDIFMNGRVLRQDGQYQEVHSSLPPAAGKILYNLITAHGVTKTLEVGFAYGISTMYICEAHKALGHTKSSHVAIDPNQSTQWEGIGNYNVQRAGLSHLLNHREVSDYVGLPLSYQLAERYQMVLVDGAHTFDYTLLDAFYADLMLDIGGFLVFDDTHMPGVDQVVSFFVTNRAYRLVTAEDVGADMVVQLGGTMMKILKKLGHDDRTWDHHVDFL